MKRLDIVKIAAVVLIATISCNKVSTTVPSGEFLVSGEVSSVADSTELILLQTEGLNMKEVGNATIIDGKFEISGEALEQGAYYALCYKEVATTVGMRKLYITPQTYIAIEGKGTNMTRWSVKSNHKCQKLLNRFCASIDSELLEGIYNIKLLEGGVMSKIRADRAHLMENLQRYRDDLHYLADIAGAAYNPLNMKQLEFLKGEKVDDTWMYLFNFTAQCMRMPEVDSLLAATVTEMYDDLPLEYQQSDTGVAIGTLVHPPKVAQVGDEMVDAKLYDVDGGEHSLSELAGRYILLDFWSSGCGPCVASFGEAERVAESYKHKLTIVSISQDPEEAWCKYVEDRALKGTHWNELSTAQLLSKSYGVRGIPSYVLISPTGVVMAKWSGYGTGMLESRVFKYLGAK